KFVFVFSRINNHYCWFCYYSYCHNFSMIAVSATTTNFHCPDRNFALQNYDYSSENCSISAFIFSVVAITTIFNTVIIIILVLITAVIITIVIASTTNIVLQILYRYYYALTN